MKLLKSGAPLTQWASLVPRWGGRTDQEGKTPPQKKQLQHLNARWFAYNTFTFIVYLNVYTLIYTLKQKVYLQLNQSADPLFISLKKTKKTKTSQMSLTQLWNDWVQLVQRVLNVPDFYSFNQKKQNKSKVPSQINHKHAPFQSLCSLQLYYISLPTGSPAPTLLLPVPSQITHTKLHF